MTPLVEHYHQDGIVSGDVRQLAAVASTAPGSPRTLRWYQSRAVYRGGNHREPHKLNNLIRPKFNYCPPRRISFFRFAPGIPVITAPRDGCRAPIIPLPQPGAPFYMRPVTDSASAVRSGDPIQESAPAPPPADFSASNPPRNCFRLYHRRGGMW